MCTERISDRDNGSRRSPLSDVSLDFGNNMRISVYNGSTMSVQIWLFLLICDN